LVKSEKYNNTILAVAEDDSVDEVECMMRNKSVQIVGGVLALTGITYVGSGCQSIQDKLDVIQSQTTTREVSIAEEMISEEKNTEKSIVTEQKTETDVADDIPSEENIDDAVYLTQYEEIISRYIELNHQKLEYGDLTNIEFPYETADDVYARYNVMLVLEELDNVGYVIDDIDGDGVKELIIADMTSPLIYDIYTMDGDVPKLVAASWERSNTTYCGNHFCTEGSGGAANFIVSYKVFKGNEMQTEYYLYTDLLENGESVFFYTTNSIMDKNNDNLITQEEYNGIKEETESGGCVYPGLKTMVEQ
jgi:hypothetical protein